MSKVYFDMILLLDRAMLSSQALQIDKPQQHKALFLFGLEE